MKEEEGYWKQKYEALSDTSDSTIQFLKKENLQLRLKVDKLSSHAPDEGEGLTTPIKEEPEKLSMKEACPVTTPTGISKCRQYQQLPQSFLHSTTLWNDTCVYLNCVIIFKNSI